MRNRQPRLWPRARPVAVQSPSETLVPREVIEDVLEYSLGRTALRTYAVDAVMAALAEHTTPRPTREQIEDAVAAGHAAGWNKGGIDASDEVVDRIEALLDGKGEADGG